MKKTKLYQQKEYSLYWFWLGCIASLSDMLP